MRRYWRGTPAATPGTWRENSSYCPSMRYLMVRRDPVALAGRVAPLGDGDDTRTSGAMISNSPAPGSGQLWGMSMSNTRLKSGI